MLHYSSAFDDEVQEVPDVDPVEVAEEVPEELPEGPAEASFNPKVDAEAPQALEAAPAAPQNEAGRPPTSEPGPYYYFYQGEPRLNFFRDCLSSIKLLWSVLVSFNMMYVCVYVCVYVFM